MAEELAALHAKLGPEPGDRWAFLGDVVDKGPKSVETMQMVRDLVNDFPGSLCLCGNHEESAIRAWELHLKNGSWDAVRRIEREPWLPELTQEMVDWLKGLPLFARPRPDVLLVHGGLFPAFYDHYGSLPSGSPEDWHRGGGRVMDRMRRILRVRHVYKPGVLSPKGKDMGGQMVELGHEGENTLRWADWYDGREGHVFYGHDPNRAAIPWINDHATGMDTWAVGGGTLTAAVLEDGRAPKAAEFVSVPSRTFASWLASSAE